MLQCPCLSREQLWKCSGEHVIASPICEQVPPITGWQGAREGVVCQVQLHQLSTPSDTGCITSQEVDLNSQCHQFTCSCRCSQTLMSMSSSLQALLSLRKVMLCQLPSTDMFDMKHQNYSYHLQNNCTQQCTPCALIVSPSSGHRVAGSVPVNEFSSSESCLSRAKLPSSGGIVPCSPGTLPASTS